MKFYSEQMDLHIKNGVGFLTFPSFEKYPFVRHAFSTRIGGVSEGEFASMNLSFGRGDPDTNVQKNYHRLCGAVEVEYESLVASAQDHHTFIRAVSPKEKGIGIYRPRDLESVDGLVTNVPGITLVTYYADCVPLFFLDPQKRVIGLAHAGWKGTVGRIGEKMILKMKQDYGCREEEILCGIGPSIGPCCYEVDAPVQKQFAALTDLSTSDFLMEKGEEKYLLNLWECNRQILMKAGVCEKHIVVTDLCTRCNHDLLFSHRATGGRRGGMAALMQIKEEFV